MQILRYGQPLGGITQISFVVDDIDEAMDEYTRYMGVGPWYVSPAMEAKGAEYRGKPSDFRLRLAIAYSGHTQVELIQQLDDRPSVFLELLHRTGPGFHHFGIATRELDADIERLRAQGGKVVFRAQSQRGARVVYLEDVGSMPGMLELIEMTPAQESFYTSIYAASLTWDGSNPVRDVASA